MYRECDFYQGISINRLTTAIRGLIPKNMRIGINRTKLLQRIYVILLFLRFFKNIFLI